MKPVDFLKTPESWQYTTHEAWDRFACARCGRPVHPSAMGNTLDKWDDVAYDEYWISGICPECWNTLFPDE